MPNFFDKGMADPTNAFLAEIEDSSERGVLLYGEACLLPETKIPRTLALGRIPSPLGIKGVDPLLLPLVWQAGSSDEGTIPPKDA